MDMDMDILHASFLFLFSLDSPHNTNSTLALFFSLSVQIEWRGNEGKVPNEEQK
jgi:hypothetical protein